MAHLPQVTLRVHKGGYCSTTSLYTSKTSVKEPSLSSIGEKDLPSPVSTTNGINRSTRGTGFNQFGRNKLKKFRTDDWRTQNAKVRLDSSDIPACSPLLGKSANKRQKHSMIYSTRYGHHMHGPSNDSIQQEAIPEEETSVMSTISNTGMSESVVDNNKQTTLLKKLGKHNFKNQVRKINKEKKAAKTVGIIVGCFIVCWFPFFTCYLIGAFCSDCTPPVVFSVFFWLGYCNSVINPCVYALFSKEFR